MGEQFACFVPLAISSYRVPLRELGADEAKQPGSR